MTITLAQASSQFSPPVGYAGWIACVVFTMWGFHIAQKIWDRSKQRPSPGEVHADALERFVAKETFVALVTKNDAVHEQIFSKIGGVERGAAAAVDKKMEELRTERRNDLSAIHHDINEVGKKVAGLEKETELQNQSMARMDSKLDRLIERKQ
jgi:hypothetical protein